LKMAELTNKLLEAYIALLTLAIIPIIIGSYKSLNPIAFEAITSTDAYMFPLVGSSFLFGLYILFKFFAADMINLLLSTYFMILGVGAIINVLAPILKVLLPKNFAEKKPFTLNFNIPFVKDPFNFEITYQDILASFIAIPIGLYYFQTKNWITNNIFGECFSIVSIELISLQSFKTGCVLLIGLFFYDIFWVFGTDVMVTVAKSFEAPIKVIWPKNELGQMALLGLGDIVIPGIFIAMMLRFDRYLARKRNLKTYSNYYFNTCFLSYIAALIVTVYVLHTFNHGQPALLYIVPFNLLSVIFLSIVKGEFTELMNYFEEDHIKKK